MVVLFKVWAATKNNTGVDVNEKCILKILMFFMGPTSEVVSRKRSSWSEKGRGNSDYYYYYYYYYHYYHYYHYYFYYHYYYHYHYYYY
jgi:hypothetical protein